MDTNKHRYYMMQVLLAIFRHPQLSQLLAFKGGTSLMTRILPVSNLFLKQLLR